MNKKEKNMLNLLDESIFNDSFLIDKFESAIEGFKAPDHIEKNIGRYKCPLYHLPGKRLESIKYRGYRDQEYFHRRFYQSG